MPILARVAITGVRNISKAELELGTGFNLIHGDNGSGKTSLLEALYLLGMGRSFRSHLQKPLISHEKSEATVFGQTLDGFTIGIQRPQRGQQSIKMGGKAAESIAQLSHALPLQLIHSDTFQLLEGSPAERRSFLDWGVFHVEHQFIESWRRARSAIEQRNALIRAEASDAEIEPWSRELAISAGVIDLCRERYLNQLKPILAGMLELIGQPGDIPLEIGYWRGWEPESGSLSLQLQQSLSRDRRYGHTTLGPHKADILFTVSGRPVADVYSRGQLKVLISALKILQAKHLIQETGQAPLFLVDDLPAELDAGNRIKVCSLLGELKAQVFMTSIEPETLVPFVQHQAQSNGAEVALFHVKHGNIVAL